MPAIRVGISLPQFRSEVEPAIEVARRAEAAGIDGVFVFDHLWPLGRPDRPALQSHVLLGALTAETERVVLGTLVSRVGLVPDAVLVHTLTSLARMCGPRGHERFVAGLGTGDRGNRSENLAYGIPFPSVKKRIRSVATCSRALRANGVRTWIGGLSDAIAAVVGNGVADGWNGWGIPVADFATRAARLPPPVEATWGGQVLIGRTSEEAEEKRARHKPAPNVVTGMVGDLRAHLAALAAAGATWAVCAPLDIGRDPDAVELVAECNRALGPRA